MDGAAGGGKPGAERQEADWLDGSFSGSGDEFSVERHGRLVSVSRRVAGLPVEGFLQAAAGQERFVWRDGLGGTAYAGMGVAAHLMGYGSSRFASIQRQAKELFGSAEISAGGGGGGNPRRQAGRPRLFGGFSFRDTFTPDREWIGYYPAQFTLPHYQLLTGEDGSWLTINTLLDRDEDASAVIPLLDEALEAKEASLRGLQGPGERDRASSGTLEEEMERRGVEIGFPLSYAQWERLIGMAKEAFADSPLQKVVLSRCAQLRAVHPIELAPAIAELASLYPRCICFLFEPQAGRAFLGATPELLARLDGGEMETMALAGSIQRGRSAAEDRALEASLLASIKDRHEHGLVVEALRQRLRPLSRRLSVGEEPSVLKFSNIQHLYTPVRATLKRQEGVLPLVKALHPTPAMGGAPSRYALAFIEAHEPTLRGWYAAPVGWIDSNMDGAFAVAVRSAVVRKERAWAYAGAGIVADSRPDKEWEETWWKLQPIIRSVVSGQPARSAPGSRM